MQLTQKKSADSYKDNYGDRNWNFVKLVNKVLQKWEELRKFQSSTLDTIARRKLIEDQNTILELSGRVQELQNEVNCMNDSKDFQDADVRIFRFSWVKGRKANLTIQLLVPSGVPLKLASEQLHQVRRMIRGIGNILFSTYSRTSNGQDPVVTWVNLWGKVITPCGPFLVSRTAMRGEPYIGLRWSSARSSDTKKGVHFNSRTVVMGS